MKKRLLALAVMVCLPLIGSSRLFAQDVESTVTKIEKSLWEAWKNKQAGPFEEYLTDNTISVGSRGIQSGKQEAIKELTGQPCDVRSYSLTDWQVHQLTADTVMVTYKAKQDASCGDTKVPPEVAASSVYVKQGDKWLAASHQETPLLTPGTAKAE